MLISFIIRHQLVQATSNAALRFLVNDSELLWISGTSELAELRQALTTWLNQYKRTNYHSDTIRNWYWYNNPQYFFEQTMNYCSCLKWIRKRASTANTTRLCWQVVIKIVAVYKDLLPPKTRVRREHICAARLGQSSRASTPNDNQIIISFVSHYWFFWGDIPYKYVFFLISWICCRFLINFLTKSPKIK